MHSLPPSVQLAVISEARSWIGTPVFHRGRVKGAGVDCVGLVFAAGVNAGALIVEPGLLKAFDGSYGLLPNPVHLRAALDRWLVRVDGALEDGDVALMTLNTTVAMHLGILARFQGRQTLIHANPNARPPRVTEATFAGAPRAGFVEAFRFKGPW